MIGAHPVALPVPMRRAAGLFLSLLVLLCAACGESSGGSGGDDAERAALSYLPKDAVTAFVVQTDPDAGQVKAALDLVRRFPGGEGILGQARQSVEKNGLSFDADIRPLLGNPVAFALLGPAADDQLLAWRVKDTDALARVIRKGTARKSGEYRGATLYSDSGSVDAVKGDLVLNASTEAEVRAALDRADAGTGLTADDFPDDLPQDALVRGTGSIAQVLAHASTQSVRRVPWLAAVKRYGFALTTGDSGVGLELRADTTGRKLDDADVPLATGDAAPKVADTGQLAVGLRDLAHVFTFSLRAAGVVNPEGTTRFRARLQALKGLANVDVERDLVDQLDSDATFTTDLGAGSALRATAKDPAALTGSLTRLERIAPALLDGAGIPGATVARVAPGLWAVSQSGSVVGAYGVVGDQFVAGSGTPSALRSLASRPAAGPEGAKGALAVRVPGSVTGRLIAARLRLPGTLAALALGRLGDLTGSIAFTPAGMHGSFKQEVR